MTITNNGTLDMLAVLLVAGAGDAFEANVACTLRQQRHNPSRWWRRWNAWRQHGGTGGTRRSGITTTSTTVANIVQSEAPVRFSQMAHR